MVNEVPIWNFLLQRIKNQYGVAAVMGNLMAESSLIPICATGKNKTSKYVEDADSGLVDFVNDKVAFGLAQWCASSRKKKLWEFVKANGKSVGDLDTQLNFLWKELSESYPVTCEMMQQAKDIRSASDAFMTRYEKPGDQSETMKQRRANYGLKFYNQFAQAEQKPASEPAVKTVKARTQVNIRNGKGKHNEKLGELKKGQSAEWLATEDGWHKIAVWVDGNFVEVIS